MDQTRESHRRTNRTASRTTGLKALMLWLLVLFASLICNVSVTAAGEQVEFICATATLDDRPAGKSVALPTTSNLRALVIFTAFDDDASGDTPPPNYAVDLFAPDLPGSLTHFYNTMSSGQFLLSGHTLPRRYRSDAPSSAYLATEFDRRGLYGQFVMEILQAADDDVDFGEFDNDGPDGLANSGDDDGVVDYVFINVSSTPPGFFIGNATGVAGLGLGDPFESDDFGPNGEPIAVLGHSTRLPSSALTQPSCSRLQAPNGLGPSSPFQPSVPHPIRSQRPTPALSSPGSP